MDGNSLVSGICGINIIHCEDKFGISDQLERNDLIGNDKIS